MRGLGSILNVIPLLFACGETQQSAPSPEAIQMIHRLVDLQRIELGKSRPSLVEIGSDRRLALDAHRSAFLMRARVRVPDDGNFVRSIPLPDALGGAKQLLLQARLRDTGTWKSLKPTVASIRDEGGHRLIDIVMQMPPGTRSREVELFVRGFAPVAEAARRYDTAEFDVPEKAFLEFGFGVLDVARDQGSVRFSVAACVDDACQTVFSENVDPLGAPGWSERRVSLVPFAGKRMALRFETQDAAQGLTLPVWANPSVISASTALPRVRGLILISLDTLRADHLPTYGYPLPTAPFIDEAFGGGGLVFENLVAAESTTSPSHMSLFASLPVSVHGVRDRQDVLTPAASTLAEELRAAGFATAAFTENGGLWSNAGIARGFERYVENRSPVSFSPEGHAAATFAAGASWLADHRDRHFFLFLHTYQVHYPYSPPAALRGRFVQRSGLPAVHDELPDRRHPALYDAEILQTDRALRAFFDRLHALDLVTDTLIVLVSDHGEEFYEHGFVGHGPTLYQGVNRVPLMLLGPGVPSGKRVTSPVGHVDVMPTILELLDLPKNPRALGRSLVELFDAQDVAVEEVPVFSEAWTRSGVTFGDTRVQVQPPTLAVRIGSRKLIRSRSEQGLRYEYFNIADDPREQHNLYPEHSEEAEDLKRLIDGFESASADRRAALEALASDHPAAKDTSPDPAIEDKLRALGYIE